jgi:hypothetical protein
MVGAVESGESTVSLGNVDKWVGGGCTEDMEVEGSVTLEGEATAAESMEDTTLFRSVDLDGDGTKDVVGDGPVEGDEIVEALAARDTA